MSANDKDARIAELEATLAKVAALPAQWAFDYRDAPPADRILRKITADLSLALASAGHPTGGEDATSEAWERITAFAGKHSASMHEAARLGKKGRDPSFEDDYLALIDYFRPASPVVAPSATDDGTGEAHWMTRYDPEDGEPYGEVCHCETGQDHDARTYRLVEESSG